MTSQKEELFGEISKKIKKLLTFKGDRAIILNAVRGRSLRSGSIHWKVSGKTER